LYVWNDLKCSVSGHRREDPGENMILMRWVDRLIAVESNGTMKAVQQARHVVVSFD
jgi:hypothetical protein